MEGGRKRQHFPPSVGQESAPATGDRTLQLREMCEHISKSRSASPAPGWDGAAGGRGLNRAGERCGGEKCGGREGAAIPFC